MCSVSEILNVRRISSRAISPRFSTTDHRRAWSPPSSMKTTQKRGGAAGNRLLTEDCVAKYARIPAWVESECSPVRPLSSGSVTKA